MRAGFNTLRCRVDYAVADFPALWMLQKYYLDLGMGTIMMASGNFDAEYTVLKACI